MPWMPVHNVQLCAFACFAVCLFAVVHVVMHYSFVPKLCSTHTVCLDRCAYICFLFALGVHAVAILMAINIAMCQVLHSSPPPGMIPSQLINQQTTATGLWNSCLAVAPMTCGFPSSSWPLSLPSPEAHIAVCKVLHYLKLHPSMLAEPKAKLVIAQTRSSTS